MRKVEHECGIYAIINIINNKSYIGMSQDIHTRWMTHKHHLDRGTHTNQHLQRAWNKYGKDNFEFVILVTCDEDLLDHYEKIFIGLFDTVNDAVGYNKSFGGEGFGSGNPESNKKRSESLKRHYEKGGESVEKRRASLRAAAANPEYIEKKKLAAKKQFEDPDFYKKYREQRSSKEYREKISKSHIGLKPSQRAIDKTKEVLSVPVRCVETGVVYPSAKEASRCLPGNKNINAVISGHRKTAGGFHWEVA